MTRIVAIATFFLLSSHAVWAAGTQQDMQAEMKKMQEAQVRMMSAMMTEKQSSLGFNETVTALQDAAKKRGWEVGPAMDMQEAMLKAGNKDAKPFKILTMCKKDLTETLLKTQAMNKAMPFVPCRFSVFEGNDGKVYIAKPNTEFMAQMATPVFAPLLQQFAAEEKAVLESIQK
jgi:uncharacterized protein (DUF302 family)